MEKGKGKTLSLIPFALSLLPGAYCFRASRRRFLLWHMAAKLIEESATRAMETIGELTASVSRNRPEAVP